MSLPEGGDLGLGAAMMAVGLFAVRTAVWLVTYRKPSETDRLEAVLRDLETAVLRVEQISGRIERDVVTLKSKS